MLDHVSLAVADFERSRAFYDQILATLGHKRVMEIADAPEYVAAGYGASALDPELVGEVLRVMRDLAEEGRTMLIVTHEVGFAREVSTRTVFLHQGRIEEEGPPKDVFGNPRSERLRQFLASHL